jgi:hypothetical protein
MDERKVSQYLLHFLVNGRRRNMKKFIVLFFVAAFCFGLAGTASAITIRVPVSTGTAITGNDNGSVSSIDGNEVVYIGGSGQINSEVVVDGSGTSGTWEYTGSDYTVEYIAIKAGKFTVYYATDGNSGEWNTEDIWVGRKKPHHPNLSHISLYGSTLSAERTIPVPIPAAAWLLGTGLVGIIGIRRKMNN